MTSRLGAFLMTGVLTVALFGCPLKRGSGDDPVDAGTITVSGTGAKNEAQITRYPNETSLGGAPALIAKDGTIARTFPGAGSQVAVLAKNTPCGKIGQYGNAGTLIMWLDPADGQNTMGWVPNASFQSGPIPSTVKTVVVPAKDASAPAVVDAGGGGAVADAGNNNVSAKVDAGATGPDFGPCQNFCASINGQCPPGKKLDGKGSCRIPCLAATAAAVCPRNWKCTSGFCTSS